jgi:hypothetical protein
MDASVGGGGEDEAAIEAVSAVAHVIGIEEERFAADAFTEEVAEEAAEAAVEEEAAEEMAAEEAAATAAEFSAEEAPEAGAEAQGSPRGSSQDQVMAEDALATTDDAGRDEDAPTSEPPPDETRAEMLDASSSETLDETDKSPAE